MSRKIIKYEEQIYKLPQYGAEVIVRFNPANPPPFWQPGPGVVIVGEHACGEPSRPASPIETMPTHDPGPSLAEIRKFQEKREGPGKPYTSADAARDGGFNPAVVSFENVAQIADQLPSVE